MAAQKPRFSYNVTSANKMLLDSMAVKLTTRCQSVVTWSEVLSYLIENHTSDIDIDNFEGKRKSKI